MSCGRRDGQSRGRPFIRSTDWPTGKGAGCQVPSERCARRRLAVVGWGGARTWLGARASQSGKPICNAPGGFTLKACEHFNQRRLPTATSSFKACQTAQNEHPPPRQHAVQPFTPFPPSRPLNSTRSTQPRLLRLLTSLVWPLSPLSSPPVSPTAIANCPSKPPAYHCRLHTDKSTSWAGQYPR